MPSPDSTRPLRGAVLGLGMIGRHHARLLQASPRVAFAGAPVVTLAEGLETVLVAEAALASARDGATVAVEVAI